MPTSLRHSAWWVWLLPTVVGADIPLLAIGFAANGITGHTLFSLWAWLSVLVVTCLSAWTANRGITYGYWLGVLSGVTGLSYLAFYRLLWNQRQDIYANLHRLPFDLGNKLNLDIKMVRDVGLFAIGVGMLFLLYDAFRQRR